MLYLGNRKKRKSKIQTSSPRPTMDSNSDSSESEGEEEDRRDATTFVSNLRGTSFMECSPRDVQFRTAREFRTPADGTPGGGHWRALFALSGKGDGGDGETSVYYGMRRPILDRIRHNACAGAGAAGFGRPFPFKYASDDWPSSGEAFDAADYWFGGSFLDSGPGELPPHAPPQHQQPADLNLDTGFYPSDLAAALSQRLPLDPEQRSPARDAYVSYSPFTPAAFRVSNAAYREYFEQKSARQQSVVDKYLAELAKWVQRDGLNVRDRIFYCGTKWADAVELMHAAPPAARDRWRQKFRELAGPAFQKADLPVSVMGDPGQCFQYGKSYRIARFRKPLYFHERGLDLEPEGPQT